MSEVPVAERVSSELNEEEWLQALEDAQEAGDDELVDELHKRYKTFGKKLTSNPHAKAPGFNKPSSKPGEFKTRREDPTPPGLSEIKKARDELKHFLMKPKDVRASLSQIGRKKR